MPNCFRLEILSFFYKIAIRWSLKIWNNIISNYVTKKVRDVVIAFTVIINVLTDQSENVTACYFSVNLFRK